MKIVGKLPSFVKKKKEEKKSPPLVWNTSVLP